MQLIAALNTFNSPLIWVLSTSWHSPFMGLRTTSWKRRRCATVPDRQQPLVLHSLLKTSHEHIVLQSHHTQTLSPWGTGLKLPRRRKGSVLLRSDTTRKCWEVQTKWPTTAAKVLPLVQLVKDRKRWRKRFLSNFPMWVCNGLASLLYFRPTVKFNKAVWTVPFCLFHEVSRPFWKNKQ